MEEQEAEERSQCKFCGRLFGDPHNPWCATIADPDERPFA